MRLTTAQRNRLPASAFAIPEWRWGPLVDARHVHSAASRLEHEHNIGAITGPRYTSAKKRIASAARRFGTPSIYLNPVEPSPFWETPLGVLVQVTAGIGVLASVYYVARNWNATSASYTLPVATTTLVTSL
jgi:hypothetical protein